MAVDIDAEVTLAAIVPAAEIVVMSVVADVVLAAVTPSAQIKNQGINAAILLSPVQTDTEIEAPQEGDGQFRQTPDEAILAFEGAVIFGESTTTITAAEREFGKIVTIQTDIGRFFDMGSRMVVGAVPNPQLNYFCGPSLEYDPATGILKMAVTLTFGSDDISSWVLYQGAPPATGDPLAAPALMHAFLGGI